MYDMVRANSFLNGLADRLNPYLTRSPLRFLEIADQPFCPPAVRRCCQNVLASEWAYRLPFIQQASPADLAAVVISKALDEFANQDDAAGITVVDFCSGSGGPVPIIEKAVNQRRRERGLPLVSFLMTDLNPHIDAWKAVSRGNSHLSFIPQSVDATDPPSSVINVSSQEDHSLSSRARRRIFRLYCLSFHHFSDAMAREVLASTLDTADGFAILELQDRRLASFILMVLDFFFIFLMTPFWFGADPAHLFFTYIVPVVPFIMSFDGIVSSLRTRTFGEVMRLIDGIKGFRRTEGLEGSQHALLQQVGKVERYGWEFKGKREVHTWPLGYFNYIVGKRKW